MLCVTYGMGFARDVADRIVFFDEGMLVELRTPHYIFNKPSEDRIRMFLEQDHPPVSAIGAYQRRSQHPQVNLERIRLR